jgi:hypothetical protein
VVLLPVGVGAGGRPPDELDDEELELELRDTPAPRPDNVEAMSSTLALASGITCTTSLAESPRTALARSRRFTMA